jgi:hypothetical protein
MFHHFIGGKVMGKYEELKRFPEKQFKRLTGVQRETFEKMVAILLEAQGKRYRKAGRKGVLSIEDRLLMALEYLREYRTYFHLGRSYGLSESACYRTCRGIEDVLIKRKRFGLRFNLIAGIHNYEIEFNDK